MTRFASVAAYLILAPFLGGLLDGIDRIISARMQRRKGCLLYTSSRSKPLSAIQEAICAQWCCIRNKESPFFRAISSAWRDVYKRQIIRWSAIPVCR